MINVYLELVRERSLRNRLAGTGLPSVHIFSTFFYDKLAGVQSGDGFRCVDQLDSSSEVSFSLSHFTVLKRSKSGLGGSSARFSNST